MLRQSLLEKYHIIEHERQELKKQWANLKDMHGDSKKIEDIGRRLTELTLNQAHILIDLEHTE